MNTPRHSDLVLFASAFSIFKKSAFTLSAVGNYPRRFIFVIIFEKRELFPDKFRIYQ